LTVADPRALWSRLEEILDRVAALQGAARDAEVVRMCGDDVQLREEALSLSRHADRVGNFLEEPALGPGFSLLPKEAAPPDDGKDRLLGHRVGRYRLEKRLGAGGMGVVYLATRDDGQFAQRVALKIVKRGMDTEEILERFRRERQTLAALEHPNIARLLDGGATESGEPFLAMEFVEGEPIDAYCDDRHLDLAARIRLLLTVCDAVEHAHRHLVVHRDLKPGNILVARDGSPKLLDFGIASVLAPGRDRTATAACERWLTPEYASPEQIDGAAATTATDVYSLGVVLYELLTGSPPYRFTTRTSEEVRKIVAGTQPLAPSEAVRRSSATAEGRDVALARGASSGELARALRGDLDTIVLCALRKEPGRRYPSIERFAADLRRHLEHLPVSARPDTLAYRAGKLVQRHALATALSAACVLSLVAGGVAVAWQARRASDERDRAVAARAQAESAARFLQQMLASADPLRSGRSLSQEEALDVAAKRLDLEFRDQPLLRASLGDTIGTTYLSLGLYDRAEASLQKALDQRLALGAEPRDVAESRLHLASVLYAERRLDEAEAELEQACAILREVAGKESVELASAASSLGVVQRAQGRIEEAEATQRTALAIRRTAAGPESLDTAESLNNLAAVLLVEQRFDEARPALEEALRIRRAELGGEHPLVAQSTDNLAVLLSRMGEIRAAEPMYRTALELELRAFGTDHPDVAVTRRSLGLLLATKGELPEAAELLRASLEAREKLFAPSDARRLTTELDLAEVLFALGRRDLATAHVESALEAARGPGSGGDARSTVLARADVRDELAEVRRSNP
jgi:eukaryotic-like serine/threonine-protein kinase